MVIKIEITAEEAIPIIEEYISKHFKFENNDKDKEHVWVNKDQDGDSYYFAFVQIPEGKKYK